MLDAVEEPKEDESLLFDLACMTVWHYFKQILPLPVRLLLRAISLGPRILKGLEEAVTGNVFKSEVLDAAAISMALITGDDEGAARNAAKITRIDTYISRALPEDKFKYIEEQKRMGHKVIMIGDGINDAPALAAADTGIAMGDCADITGETADILAGIAEIKNKMSVN